MESPKTIFLSAAAGAAIGHLGISKALKLGEPSTGGPAKVAARTVLAGVTGGIVSEVSGGSFPNGAYTAAFQHLFSEVATAASKPSSVRMVYPEGGSQEFGDYGGKLGIAGMGQDAQYYANAMERPYLMYDKSGFQLSELLYVGLQKISFGLLDFKGAQAANLVSGLNYGGPMNIIYHSQGTLIANRIMASAALPSGSTVTMNAPAANYFTAKAVSSFRGYNLQYNQVHGDWIGFVNLPHPNITKNFSAIGGIFRPSRNITQYAY